MRNFTADQAAPAVSWRAVVTSDTVDLPAGCRSVYVGGAGDITAVSWENEVVLFTGVPAGTILPIQPRRINATGTSATLMVALY